MPGKGDISGLAGFVNEPYRKEEVLAAMRRLDPPLRLRQIYDEARLPRYIVQRVLSRLVADGVLARRKLPMTVTGFSGRSAGGEPRRGQVARMCYVYRFVEGA